MAKIHKVASKGPKGGKGGGMKILGGFKADEHKKETKKEMRKK